MENAKNTQNYWKNFIAPFGKVAGAKALAWGVAGLAVSAVAANFSGWHAQGLLHFGPPPGGSPGLAGFWWLFSRDYLIIWLVPAIIIYGLGAALSKSRIRAVDVFGTTAFSMLPLAAMNIMFLLPQMRELLNASIQPLAVEKIMAVVINPFFILAGIVMTAMIVLMLVWLFNAVKVSCNLKGWQLWTVFVVGVFGGDTLCRLLIGLMY